MVGINEAMITCPEAPFGGVKESGIGKEVIYYLFRNLQYLCELYLLHWTISFLMMVFHFFISGFKIWNG